MLSYREDCAFVISTHDISLPLDQSKCSALLVRNYTHDPKGWTIDYIQAVEEMDELTAQTVLGSRRKILFIEGKASSLDLQIYQILYPDLSIKPIGSCVEIERIVKGLNSSESLHWISAIGIVDRDNRKEQECAELIKQGIIPLNHYSVESIYYHPNVIRSVLERVATIQSINIEETFLSLKSALLDTFKAHISRMAARLVEREVRDTILHQTPSWKQIENGSFEINFSTQELFEKEKEYLTSLIEKQDIATLISRYPIRETPSLKCVSTALKLQSPEQYEQVVRKMLIDNDEEKNKVLELLKPVTDYISSL